MFYNEKYFNIRANFFIKFKIILIFLFVFVISYHHNNLCFGVIIEKNLNFEKTIENDYILTLDKKFGAHKHRFQIKMKTCISCKSNLLCNFKNLWPDEIQCKFKISTDTFIEQTTFILEKNLFLCTSEAHKNNTLYSPHDIIKKSLDIYIHKINNENHTINTITTAINSNNNDNNNNNNNKTKTNLKNNKKSHSLKSTQFSNQKLNFTMDNNNGNTSDNDNKIKADLFYDILFFDKYIYNIEVNCISLPEQWFIDAEFICNKNYKNKIKSKNQRSIVITNNKLHEEITNHNKNENECICCILFDISIINLSVFSTISFIIGSYFILILLILAIYFRQKLKRNNKI